MDAFAHYSGGGMDFSTKILKLIELRGMRKSELASKSAISRSVLSKYLNRRSIPPATIAIRVARALDVSLDWLADDARDWPPPSIDAPRPDQLSHEELMREVGRRYWNDLSFAWSELRSLRAIDWVAECRAALDVPFDEQMPAEQRRRLLWPMMAEHALVQLEHRYDPIDAAERFGGYVLPDDPDGDDLDVQRLVGEFKSWRDENAASRVADNIAHLRSGVNINDLGSIAEARKAREKIKSQLAELSAPTKLKAAKKRGSEAHSTPVNPRRRPEE